MYYVPVWEKAAALEKLGISTVQQLMSKMMQRRKEPAWRYRIRDKTPKLNICFEEEVWIGRCCCCCCCCFVPFRYWRAAQLMVPILRSSVHSSCWRRWLLFLPFSSWTQSFSLLMTKRKAKEIWDKKPKQKHNPWTSTTAKCCARGEEEKSRLKIKKWRD